MKQAALKRCSRRPATSPSYAILAAVALLLLAIAQPGDARADTLRTGGTGSAAMLLRKIGNAFTAQAPDTSVEVIPSLGSTGAIAAVVDGALDFAVSARPLAPAEAVKSLTEMILARTVFGLASSYPDPGNIASSDVAGFFTNPTSSWPDGTRLRIILRPRSEVDSTLLAKAFPNMAGAIEQLRLRAEIPVAATDQDNVRMAERMPGSLVSATLAQMQTEKPNLHFLMIDGVAPTLENFERGAYPYHKDFYFILPARRTPSLDRFVAFLRSPEGAKLLREAGSLPGQP
ncbi:MAG: ABC-type phosphate transport system periplasmic component-like [Bradyrhizobium sp.]|nr:ABC-type phosphate transport system periplasmic component-like [Bradyrhizobium sp.]